MGISKDGVDADQMPVAVLQDGVARGFVFAGEVKPNSSPWLVRPKHMTKFSAGAKPFASRFALMKDNASVHQSLSGRSLQYPRR